MADLLNLLLPDEVKNYTKESNDIQIQIQARHISGRDGEDGFSYDISTSFPL